MDECKGLVYFLYMNQSSVVGVDIEKSVHHNEAALVSGGRHFEANNDILFKGKSPDERPTLQSVFETYIEFEKQGLKKDEVHSQMLSQYDQKTRTR